MTKNPSLLKNPEIDAWISFSMDGLINVRIGKVDIGQQISTAIARIVSEELDLDPKRIVMAMPDTINSPNEGMTSGSNSMEESGNAIRLAAATIREVSVRHTSEADEVGLISGVELSCRWATTTVHVVGLNFDADALQSS